MGRAPCCSKVGLHKGPWTPREDTLLTKYIQAHGEGQWKSLPKKAGLLRCGKSCRLRWMNYLRPDIKRGNISPEEDDLIIRMHSLLGNKWSLIAGRLPGRTDNEIKNYWNTHLSKKVKSPGSDSKYQEQEGSSSKKKSKKSNNNKKQSKREKKKSNNKNKKGSNNDYEEEPQKTQVYLPKPIRVKPSCLPRTNSTTTFTTTFDDSTISGSTIRSQEKDQEEIVDIIVDPTKSNEEEEEQNNIIMVNDNINNNNNVEELLENNNDGFGFFCDEYDLVNNSEMEGQSYFATDHHGTLEKVYEEYLQLLNMEDNMFELDSFAQSLMV